MGIFLLILGVIIIAVVYPTLNGTPISFLKTNKKPISEDKKIEELEEKIDILSNNVEEVLDRLSEVPSQRYGNVGSPKVAPSFSQSLVERQTIEEYDEIIDAYHKGEEIVDIAKRFNRGKGEIQLILNLKK
ncbi:MAG: hypothetical protein APF76_05665 [Desulfitibacter sp. BRH_c19]|nr:MAG: hypothetical protein APF76_05665 [Desulfitibacter sp. BRH_c19]